MLDMDFIQSGLGFDVGDKTVGKFRHEHVCSIAVLSETGDGDRAFKQSDNEPSVVFVGFGCPPDPVIDSLSVVPRKSPSSVVAILGHSIFQFWHERTLAKQTSS